MWQPPAPEFVAQAHGEGGESLKSKEYFVSVWHNWGRYLRLCERSLIIEMKFGVQESN